MRTDHPATNRIDLHLAGQHVTLTFGEDFGASGGCGLDGSGGTGVRALPAGPSNNPAVFVIHGRDPQVERDVFGFLRALRLRPLDWESLVAATGSTLPSLLDVVTGGLTDGTAQAVLAVLSPDDEVRLHPSLHKHREDPLQSEVQLQPRPDVLLELGGALTVCRERTIVVELGDLRPISDISGLNVIRFDGVDNKTPMRKLVNRLRRAGCPVDDSDIDWGKPEWFGSLDAHARHPGTGGGSDA
jgi:predicted nucleotide-binding protein